MLWKRNCLDFLVTLLVFHFKIQSVWCQDLDCSFLCQNMTNPCIVSGQLPPFNGNLTCFNDTLQVQIQDSALGCESFPCYFYLNVLSLLIEGSSLYFSDIYLESPATIITSSTIASKGTQIGGLGSPSDTNSGGVSYAGQGGFCTTTSNNLQYGTFYTLYNDSNPELTFGSGFASQPENSLGGGKIVIISHQNLTLGSTTIDASGFGNCSSQQLVNGGCGGYVWIERYTKGSYILNLQNVTIDVSGGQGCQPSSWELLDDKWRGANTSIGLGGSGGRVILALESNTITTNPTLTINISGGNNNYLSNACARGAAGTLYSWPDGKLVIKNSNISTQASTILASQVNLTTLEVSELAQVSFDQSQPVVLSASTLLLNQGNIFYSNSTSTLTINVTSFNGQSSNIISRSPLFNLNYVCQFIIDNTSTIATHSLFIYLVAPTTTCTVFNCKGVLKSSDAGDPNTYNTPSQLIIYSSPPFDFQNQSKVSFDYVYFFLTGKGTSPVGFSQLIMSSKVMTCNQVASVPPINPLLLDENKFSDHLLNLTSLVALTMKVSSLSPSVLSEFASNYIAANYTIFLFVEDSLQIQSSSIIVAARLGIFARNLTIDGSSKVNANGQGCSQGLGVGFINNQIAPFCPGSGGSHGGLGGPGVSQLKNKSLQIVCNSLVGTTYGSHKQFPFFEGSGGGSNTVPQQGGTGGGVVILGVKYGLIYGRLSADGYIGNVPLTSNAGSGSGGSVQIHTVGRLGGNGTISAEGGPETDVGGGFGGGGRISFNFLNWSESDKDISNLDTNLTFSVSNGGGKNSSISVIHYGSIISTPCPPGYYGFACLPCPPRTYKEDFGNGDCLPCQNMVGNSYFTGTIGQTNYLCEYECEGVDKAQNPFCVSGFYYYTQSIGGIYGVSGLLIFILILVIFILKKNAQEKALKKIIKKNPSSEKVGSRNYLGRMHSGDLSNRSPKKMPRTSFANGEQWKILSKEDSFLVEDLPYLKHRLYLKGSNTPYNPWFLSEEPPKAIAKQVDINAYLLFAQDLNNKCLFSKKWIILLDILIAVYAPLYLALLRYIQKKVYKEVQAFLKESDYNFWRVMKCRVFPFSMKLSTSQDYMWGAVEILDYKKEFDDWDGRDLFPFVLALGGRGSFYHPLHLNLSDPLVVGIHRTFHEMLNCEYSQDESEINLEKEEGSPEKVINFLWEFNKLVRQIDFGAFEDWFLKQVCRAINFVDNHNKNLFNPAGFNVRWSVEVSSKPKCFPQSSIIYHLSESYDDFSLSDIRQIHSQYHYNSDVSIQFLIKIAYDRQNKKNMINLFKEPLNLAQVSSLESPIYPNQKLSAEQLKQRLFVRLDNQGRLNQSPKERKNSNNIDEVTSNSQNPKWRDGSTRISKKTCGNRFKRFFKLLRYFVLGYRHRILQKYILTISILFLLVVDLALIVMIVIMCNLSRFLINVPYPFAAFLVPIGELIWVAGSSSVQMGKLLLTLNLMAFIDIIPVAIYTESQLVQVAVIPLMLVKILTGIFGCQYVSYLDSIKGIAS